MSETRFIQWSGWLCIFGGLFFAASSVSQLQLSSGLAFGGMYLLSLYALVPGMALIMLGLVGIWLRYQTVMEWFGKTTLLITLISAGVTSLGWLLTLTIGNSFWIVFLVGWLVHMAGQTSFGGFAATTHLLPKWNFALLIGSALPLTVVVLGLRSQPTAAGPNWGAFVMLLLISASWLLTGWALNSQPAEGLQPLTTA